MNVIFFAKLMNVAGLLVLLTACNLLGGCDAAKKKEDPKQQKAQSGKGKESVIDQELQKQYDIYQEIIKYQIEQDKKMIKQSEERYKKLKEESDK
ncbi:hypothetical protein [Paenibacillus sedimenti]|uniref:Lipoprotein n=1 Tax=Paenibacillus sedimenti TaxID=2770274 RepID=A0A926KR29_9BACL|nr:hypothetical protein [Paenibacillus sedimenti]MBD0380753.1 hypothetical protein [Paenibacillus sedimenti]